MLNKLKVLAVSLIGIVSGFLPSINSSDFVIAKADTSNVEYTSTKLNWCHVAMYGAPIWHDSSSTIPSISESIIADYNSYNFASNIISNGEEIFSNYYSYTDFDETCKEYAEHISYYTSNLNYYSTGNSDLIFSIPFETSVLEDLIGLSNAYNTGFKIPCLILDDEVFAVFDIDHGNVNLLTSNSMVKSVGLAHEHMNYVTSYTASGAPGERAYIDYLDIIFVVKKGTFEKISEFTSLTTDDGRFVGSVYFPLTRDHMILPYDITYFDYNHGSICLGHSIYGDQYGTDNPTKMLSKVTFEVESDGKKTYSWTSMSKSQYQTYIVSGNYTESQKRAALLNKMVYGPRGTYEDEIAPTGTGGLVWEPYCPYYQYEITADSVIKIKQLSFVTKSSSSNFATDGYDEVTYVIPDGAMKYGFYYTPAVGKFHYNMWNTNESDIQVVSYQQSSNWWDKLVTAIVRTQTGGAYSGIDYYNDARTHIASSGKNIQRFYFNFQDSENKVINTVKKIEFSYQIGNRKQEVISYNDDGTSNLKSFSDLETKYKVVDVQDTSYSVVSDFFADKVTQENAFVSIVDDPETMKNGKSYDYYYQNIYNVREVNGEIESENFMCYYSPLTILYEMPSGYTKRLTSNVNGNYLKYDKDGVLKVFNIDDSSKPTDISVEDYLTDRTNGNTENPVEPEIPDVDKPIIDSNWWDSLIKHFGGFWDNAKTIIFIALGIVGAIIFIFIFFKSATLLAYSSNTREVRKMNRENRRRRKRGE